MNLVDTVVGHPRVFNLLMDLAGRAAVLRPIQPWLDQLTGVVVDIGGGTGRIRDRLPSGVRFMCVDLDTRKLRYASGAIVGDAGALPFDHDTIDAALLIGLMHHLDEPAVHRVIADIARVLKRGARAIVLDPVRVSSPKLTSRALWMMDRGNHPHTADQLQAAFQRRFHIEQTSTYTVLHHYLAMRCVKAVLGAKRDRC